MGGIHVGDCFPGFLSPERRRDLSYHDASATKRPWAGREVMDSAAVVAAVPADDDGDVMIEVDERSLASKMESHRISFEWALRALAGVGS
jgi:inosose dehydratase